jgi:prolyl oligopeptidase
MSLSSLSLGSVEEIIHGALVRDPYRWLEDRGLPETQQWIEEQRVRCEAYFSDCNVLEALRGRVRSFLNVEVVDQPTRVHGFYFYRRRNRYQEQACIYVKETATGRERLLVDPSGEGPFTSVTIHRIADDASLLAYEVKHGGGDAKEIRIVEVESGRILPDRIASGYARGFTFTSRNDGFYYSHEIPSATGDHLIRLHSFSDPFEDQVIFSCERTPQSRLALIADNLHLGAMWIREDDQEFICDLFVAPRAHDCAWKQVFVNKRMPHCPMLHRGRIFVLTFNGATNGKIIELAEDGRELRTVVTEGSTPPYQAVAVGDRFFVNYLESGCSSIRCWTLEGEDAGGIDIPTDGAMQILPQLSSPENGFFYTHESFSQPPQIYEYALSTGQFTLWNRRGPSLVSGSIDVKSLSVQSKDGTVIPVTLVRSQSVEVSPETPVIMTGYGGFGVPMTPQFSVLVTIMIELGAVFALPHIRGGGEFGREWHDAGRGRNRQTAIDDFVAVAEWLCGEGMTSPAKLAIFGGSNSGLLVGAAMTQRPDLFQAVLSIAPLLDMVRYERFDHAAKWRHEYGTVEDPDDFRALYAYSPYHHVSGRTNYPATMFVGGDKDDRCNPAHVRKMAALLQGHDAQRRSVIVDYSEHRGHSPVLPLSVRTEALARRIVFLCNELNIAVPSGGPHEAARA